MTDNNKCKQCGEYDIATKHSKTLCFNCWQKQRNETKAKQSDAAAKRHERDRQEKKETEDAVQFDAESIILPQNFDLEEKYEDYKALNLAGDGEFYNEKFAFAAWLNADARTREPKSALKDVAAILGVTVDVLYKWRKSGALKKIAKRVMDHNMRYAAYPLYLRQMARGLARGNKDAVASYEKLFVFTEDDGLKSDEAISDEEFAKAREINENNGLPVDTHSEPKGATHHTTRESINDRLIDNG